MNKTSGCDGDEGTAYEYREASGTRRVVIEDDGRTGYAYLLDGDEIVSDVWLYNRYAIADVRWDDPADLPFPNRAELIRPGLSLCVTDTSHVVCVWDRVGVDILVDGQLVARLEAGVSPGWSFLAAIDGPCARSLESRPGRSVAPV